MHTMLRVDHASHVNQSSVEKDTGNATGSAGCRRVRIEKATAIHSQAWADFAKSSASYLTSTYYFKVTA